MLKIFKGSLKHVLNKILKLAFNLIWCDYDEEGNEIKQPKYNHLKSWNHKMMWLFTQNCM